MKRVLSTSNGTLDDYIYIYIIRRIIKYRLPIYIYIYSKLRALLNDFQVISFLKSSNLIAQRISSSNEVKHLFGEIFEKSLHCCDKWRKFASDIIV